MQQHHLPNFLHANSLASITPSQAFLGVIFNYPEHFEAYRGEIKKEYFDSDKDKFMFETFEVMMKNHSTIDPVLVLNHLRHKFKNEEKIEAAFDYLCNITNNQVTLAYWNIEAYRECVLKDYLRRQMMIKLYSHGNIQDGLDAIPEVIAMQKLAEKEISIKIYDANQAVEKHEQMQLEYLKYQHRYCLGIRTGFNEIDASTQGIMKNTLTVIGGDTGHGKTDFLMNIIRNIAVSKDADYDVHVMLFNFEMVVANVMNRLMSIDSELNKGDVRKCHFVNENEYAIFESSKERILDSEIKITSPEGTDAYKIKLAVEKWKQITMSKHDGKKELFFVVCVDYLQIVGVPKTGLNQKRNYQIAEITRCLREISLSENTSVVTLSQYNREYKKDNGKRLPNTYDLQDSSEIEKASDCVWLIHNPFKFKIENYEDGSPTKNSIEIVDAKNREGETRVYKIFYDPSTGKMKNDSDYTQKTPYDDHRDLPKPTKDISEPTKEDLPF